VRDVAARIPERFGVPPVHQVIGYALRNDAAAAFRSGGVPCRQQHPPLACRLIPEDERIPPVPGLIAVRGAEGELGVLHPGLHAIGAGGLHDQLQGNAVRSEVPWVLSGVEQAVVAAFIDDDAARVSVEVRVGVASVGERNTLVRKLREVFGGDQVPRGPRLRV